MSNEVFIQIALWLMAVITVLLAWECIAEYRDAKRRRLLRHRPLQTWELYAQDEDENWWVETDGLPPPERDRCVH